MFYEKYVKRFFDIVLCSIALVGLSPLLLVTAIAIKVSSPGPVFYHSNRFGKNKVPFKFYKFRSMTVVEPGKDKCLCIADPERVFTVGKIIRRFKIDELPQLINVIKGDMSIVGPRPMAVASFYSGTYENINSVKPGLTSAASLYDYTVGETYTDDKLYRKEVLPKKLELELLYLKKMGFKYDASLILRTILTIACIVFNRTKKIPSIPELKEIKS